MMLAHYVWERTPRGHGADEATLVAALDRAAADSAPLMSAIGDVGAFFARETAAASAISELNNSVHPR